MKTSRPTHLGIPQITLTEFKPRVVTVIQYGRSLWVYEPGDDRIAQTAQKLKDVHAAAEAGVGILPTESQRMQAMLVLSQKRVEIIENVGYAHLTSEETRVEMMDVHNFVDGKTCC